jgi:hypothetical protein
VNKFCTLSNFVELLCLLFYSHTLLLLFLWCCFKFPCICCSFLSSCYFASKDEKGESLIYGGFFIILCMVVFWTIPKTIPWQFVTTSFPILTTFIIFYIIFFYYLVFITIHILITISFLPTNMIWKKKLSFFYVHEIYINSNLI